MSIDCNDWCKEHQTIIYNLQKNNGDGRNNENIQLAATDHHSCMMDCESRNRHRDGGGKRKKYINKKSCSKGLILELLILGSLIAL